MSEVKCQRHGVQELPYRVFWTNFIPCTPSVSMAGNGDFENRHQIFYFFTYRP